MKNKIEIIINGMHCEHCKKRVEEALNKIENVNKVKVDLKTGKTIITSKDIVDFSTIEETIKNLGYEVEK